VVLFVRLRDGVALDDALRGRIAKRIRENATPRHVPARIVQVADIRARAAASWWSWRCARWCTGAR